MKNILIFVGLIFGYKLLAGGNKGSLPSGGGGNAGGGGTGANSLLDNTMVQIDEVYQDNEQKLDTRKKEQILNELSKLQASYLQIVYTYFYNLNNGLELPERLNQSMDAIFPHAPSLVLSFKKPDTVYVTDLYKIRNPLGDVDGEEKSEFWTVFGQVSDLVGGRAVYGLANAIGNLFCGKRCHARRAARGN
jgi:hypothetical protein